VFPLHGSPTAPPVTQFQSKSRSPKKCRRERKVRVAGKRAKHSERREVIPPTESDPTHRKGLPVPLRIRTSPVVADGRYAGP